MSNGGTECNPKDDLCKRCLEGPGRKVCTKCGEEVEMDPEVEKRLKKDKELREKKKAEEEALTTRLVCYAVLFILACFIPSPWGSWASVVSDVMVTSRSEYAALPLILIPGFLFLLACELLYTLFVDKSEGSSSSSSSPSQKDRSK
jgi:hypothetical protein